MNRVNGRVFFVRVLLAGLLAGVVCAGAGAAVRSQAHIGAVQVVRAFKQAGVPLYNPGSGLVVGSPVTSLTTLRPVQGWNAAIYIYPSVREAKASFNAGSKRWRAAGFAAQTLRNLVVTVVPKGRVLSHKAKPWPMPKTVVKALDLLAHPAG
jgi:hypothetical protein